MKRDIPRKVKKVSAKVSPTKKHTINKKLEPSEADTQTIHIPEDVFSFSDDAKKKEKHTDWTGEGGKADSYYVPNYVIHNDFERHSDQVETNTVDQSNTRSYRWDNPSIISIFVLSFAETTL